MSAMTKKHNRKLGLLGAAMTTTRLPRYTIEVGTKVRDDVESIMLDSGFLDGAPFEWVTVSLRYGLKNDDEPIFESVNGSHGDLPLAIELDTRELAVASREEMKLAFEIATLKALVAAGRKFDLEFSPLQDRLDDIMGK
jgi:hypothetical protein